MVRTSAYSLTAAALLLCGCGVSDGAESLVSGEESAPLVLAETATDGPVPDGLVEGIVRSEDGCLILTTEDQVAYPLVLPAGSTFSDVEGAVSSLGLTLNLPSRIVGRGGFLSAQQLDAILNTNIARTECVGDGEHAVVFDYNT